MKIIRLIVFGMLLFFISGSAQAQISVQVNLGTPPQWGPSGYSDVQYYYLPDVEAYYDVHSSKFIYYHGNSWIHSSSLPNRYKDYDLYSGYKVVMSDYHGKTPYTHFHEHKGKYKKGYRGKPQPTYGHKPGRGNSPNGNFSKGSSSQKFNKNNNSGDHRGKNNKSEKGESHGKGNGKKK